MSQSGGEISADDPLHGRALDYLKWGYFDGVIDLCEADPKGLLDKPSWLSWVNFYSRMYARGDRWREVEGTDVVGRRVATLSRGQGLAEVAVLAFRRGDIRAARWTVKSLLAIARGQSGVVVNAHPTAILDLAELVLRDLGDRDDAILLVNIALGHPGRVYVSLDDVRLLAFLLSELQAPAALWADWALIFVQHVTFSFNRCLIFNRSYQDEKAANWAMKEDARSEFVLVEVLGIAPKIAGEILVEVAKAWDKDPLAEAVSSRVPNATTSVYNINNHELWLSDDALKMRYFWRAMTSAHEQALVKNGDWAIVSCPTQDYSMAVAQPWRALEATFKRSIAVPLAELFAANPEWLEWDRANLSSGAQKRESIFLEKLSDPKRAKMMTMGDLLLLLEKCLQEPALTPVANAQGSRLRAESTRWLRQYYDQLEPTIRGNIFRPARIRQEQIERYRNRASHDEQVGEVDAYVGRVIALSILETLYWPALRQMGFVASL